MGEEVYLGDPNANSTSLEYENYEAGFRTGCYGLVEYSICISLGSAIMEKFDIIERFPIKVIFASAYATGIFSFYFEYNESYISMIMKLKSSFCGLHIHVLVSNS